MGFSFTVVLIALSATSCRDQNNSGKSLRLTSDGWMPAVENAGDERDSFSYQLNEIKDGLEFSITGVPGSPRTVKWTKEIEALNVGDYPYIVMEYQAGWLNSIENEIIGVTIQNDSGGTRDTILLRMSDLIVDNHPHTIIIKNSKSVMWKKMIVSLNTRSSKAYLFIKSIAFIKSEKEFPDCIGYDTPAMGRNTSLQCVDITNRYNTSFLDFQKGLLNTKPVINDGGKYFSGSKIEIDGIPFQVRPDGENLLSFPPESKVNDEIIVYFGKKVRRGSVAPISRDDKIEVIVQSPASEIYFLLAAEHPRTSTTVPVKASIDLYPELDTKHPETIPPEPIRIYMIEDIETFAVELVYEDGTIDFAFPYSIKDEKHIIQRTFAAYVVPASGKPLNKVVFHNRTIGKDYFLGAVTINKDQSRLFPQLVTDPGPKPMQETKIPEPDYIAPFMQYQNGIISLGNTYIEMTIDARNVFTITRFNNKWFGDEGIKLDPTPGFEVTLGKSSVDIKDFRLLKVSDVSGTSVKEITLNYGLKHPDCNLEFQIKISVSGSPEVGMQMIAVNNSEKDLKAKVVFPILKGIQMGKAEDAWYYYPSVRNFFSNQTGSYDHIYSLSFPMQFYDVYNPVLGGGFYLATRETDVNEIRRYGLRKNERGISCYIEYPEIHNLLKSNAPDTLCKTIFGVHKGDWHAAMNIYKQWLMSWYKPLNSQDKQWYKECFWLLCDLEVRDFTWYDTIKKHYTMRDILEENKRNVGAYPDILHFWSWTQNMPRGYSRWGAYGTNGEYERLGGVNNFSRAINDIQKNMGIKASIYIDASLCNRDLPIAKKIGPGGAMQKITGGPVIDYRSYRMCPGVKEWRDYMQGVYKRVNKELGIEILYVDEWAAPFYFGHIPMEAYTCYGSDHEHEIPANMNLEVNKFMRELRTATPKKVALYGEYPDVDVNTKYYDSNINYYLASWSTDVKEGRDNVAYDLEDKDAGLYQPYLNLYKFAFPGLIQLSLPSDVYYYSWNRLKFSFMNGDAIYDNFWLRYESKAEAFMRKSHAIKLKYADCFTSSTPEALVPAEKAGIMANKFPGKGRILWTIYNQRYTTVRGEIMKVNHVKGATYYDVWNDKPLQVRISDDYAFISLEMQPQDIGCIIQSVKQ